jgi:hypothetical protein
MKKHILFIAMAISFMGLFAQVRIPDGNFSFELPKGWKYLSTNKVDNRTKVYLYSAQELVSAQGDTTLPFLRIYVRTATKNKTAMELSIDRFMEQPFQTMEEYTSGLFLPTRDAIAYLGANRDEVDGTENQFYILYFMHKNTAIEFRLQTTKETFEQVKNEFETILKSIVAY